MNRRRFLRVALGAAAAGVGLGMYTWKVEPFWLEVVRRRLPVSGLPPSLEGRSLAQLSDLHVGPRISDAYILDVFDTVRVISPDIVVYTGDFTTYEADIHEHAARVYARVPRGGLGTFGILGNHDYGPGWAHPEVAARHASMLTAAGVRILSNEVAEVSGLQIAGMDDLWAQRFDAAGTIAKLAAGRPAIVLSHNPDTVDLPGWEDYRGWILAGHTHGGQCKPPFLPPPLLPVRNRRYTAGDFEIEGGRRMYISRGIGHLRQVRFNARPELTVFELRRA
jgi:predicted MPP superfamily phosphohydrolase